MSVDKSTVVRIAQLAKIKVPEEDLKTLAEELSRIIEWVDQLNEVNTDGVVCQPCFLFTHLDSDLVPARSLWTRIVYR